MSVWIIHLTLSLSWDLPPSRAFPGSSLTNSQAPLSPPCHWFSLVPTWTSIALSSCSFYRLCLGNAFRAETLSFPPLPSQCPPSLGSGLEQRSNRPFISGRASLPLCPHKRVHCLASWDFLAVLNVQPLTPSPPGMHFLWPLTFLDVYTYRGHRARDWPA